MGWITVSIEEPTTIVNELGTEGGENIIEKWMEINKTNRLTEKVYWICLLIHLEISVI